MAVALRITAEGFEKVEAALRALNPQQRPKAVRQALVRCALQVQKVATQDVMIRGGQGPPHPTRLTSRTGTLRRSYVVNRRPLPRAVEVGSALNYARTHEFGFRGTVRVRRHARDVAFGRRVAPFFVGPYSRKMNLPARPVLQPALRRSSGSFSRIFRDEIERQVAQAAI